MSTVTFGMPPDPALMQKSMAQVQTPKRRMVIQYKTARVTPDALCVEFDWLLSVAETIGLASDYEVFRAFELTLAYIAKRPVERDSLRATAITALALACKAEYDGDAGIRIMRREELCDKRLSLVQLMELEKDMLQALEFNVCFPTSLQFLDSIILRMDKGEREHRHMAHAFLVLLYAYAPNIFCEVGAATAATAAALVSMRGIEQSAPADVDMYIAKSVASDMKVLCTKFQHFKRTAQYNLENISARVAMLRFGIVYMVNRYEASPIEYVSTQYKARFPTWDTSYEETPTVLGSGSFGSVVLVRKRIDGGLAALKRIKLGFGDCTAFAVNPTTYVCKDGVSREGVREVAFVARLKSLNCPYIIQVLDVFFDEPSFAIVYEYVPGGSLFDAIRFDKISSEAEKGRVMNTICTAVDCIHRNGILHLDLKPENIMYDHKSGVLKVTDFGLAEIFNMNAADTHEYNDKVQTYCYRAPEVFLQFPRDPAADAWSVGCIALVLFNGFVVIQSDSLTSVNHMDHLFKMLGTPSAPEWPEARAKPLWRKYVIQNYPKRDVKEYMSGASPEAQDFVRQLLVMNPDRRMTMHEALQHAFVRTKTRAAGRAMKVLPAQYAVLGCRGLPPH